MLTTEQILDVAENVLRKYGPRKITVIDVARELDVSHGTVYRHFSSKAELHEAITARWLERISSPLSEIVNKKTSPKKRLREWFEKLIAIKHDIVINDPEMFESYSVLAKKMPKQKKFKHITSLFSQVEQILTDGKEKGVFDIDDCAVTARTLFFGTVRYHHPLHALEWEDKQIMEDFDQLFSLFEKAICTA